LNAGQLVTRSRGLNDGKKTRSYPNGDAAGSQPDRDSNAHGAGAVEAKQSGPTVDTPNYAKPSCYGQETVTQEAAQHAARLRAGSATFLKLPVAISGCVLELDILIGLL
jgi:hypothetical protein